MNTRRFLLTVAVLGSGCASVGPQGPVEIVTRWRAAALAGDVDAAAACVVPNTGIWPDDGAAPPGQVDAQPGTEAVREARWRLAHGGNLVVAGPQVAPLITAGVLGLTRASDPGEAAQLFSRAWREQDFGLILSLLPNSERPAWTAESLSRALRAPERIGAIGALAEQLRAGGSPVWLEPGVRALIETPAGSLLAIAEDDGWKVADLRPSL